MKNEWNVVEKEIIVDDTLKRFDKMAQVKINENRFVNNVKKKRKNDDNNVIRYTDKNPSCAGNNSRPH